MSSVIPSFTTMTDVLASEGILNYDATAYVKGTTPRYIGKPSTYGNSGVDINNYCGVYSNPYQGRAYGAAGEGKDAFVRSEAESKGNSWSSMSKETKQKIGLAGIGVVVAAFIASKTKTFGKIAANAKEKASNLLKDTKGKAQEIVADTKNKGTAEKAKGIVGKAKALWARIPKKFKIGGVVVAALFGAYEVAKQARRKHVEGTEPPKY